MMQLIDRRLKIILYILLAYVFAVGIRYIWVFDISKNQDAYHNSQIMINNVDGYSYAEGARDILEGSNQLNDDLYMRIPLSKIIAFFTKYLPFNLETVMLYISSYIGSLIVVPIILIASLILDDDETGLIAAMLGGVAWSYYNRTMTGYLDTDLLVITLPLLAITFIMLSIKHKSYAFTVITVIVALFAKWYYPQSTTLLPMLYIGIFGYAILFDRKNMFLYKMLSILFLSFVFGTLTSMIVTFLLASFFIYIKDKYDRYSLYLLAVVVLYALIQGIFNPLLSQIGVYLLRGFDIVSFVKDIFISSPSVITDANSSAIVYKDVITTVREASNIPFEVFANRISGSTFLFTISSIGYAILISKHKIMLITLPMALMGYIAMKSGLRFTVYAVPFNALGVGYFFMFFGSYIFKSIESEKGKLLLKTAYILGSLVLVLYPNIKHIKDYKVPTTFVKKEVDILEYIKSVSNRNDYVLTWWDYGYPIKFYADVKVLIEGGRHDGASNFPISFALFYPQTMSANMARLNVEYYEKTLKNSTEYKFLKDTLKEYNIKDTNTFLSSLDNKNFKLPQKTADIYYYLPLRMFDIFPVVASFSNIDLKSGKEIYSPFYMQSTNFKNTGDSIILDNGVIIDLKTSTLLIGRNKVKINTFSQTYTKPDNTLFKNTQVIDRNSNLHVIFLRDYNRFIIVDNNMFNSTYLQLFIFENYDKELFEPVMFTPYARVYKLKK